MPDVALIQLPGGPYRLTITDHAGVRWFTASEMVATDTGPAWLEVADAPEWQQLVHELLVHYFEGAEVAP